MGQRATAQQPAGAPIGELESAQLFASPASIKQAQGKYPASVPLMLWLKGCTPSQSKDPAKIFASTSTYTVTAFGAGLYTSGNMGVSDCQLTTTLNITAAATPGNFTVLVMEVPDAQKPNGATSRGYALFSLIDPAAGAIPGNQQVDVIWGVLSKHMCKDDFGGHLSNDVYCIEVKIGNNTGYGIQLAGVGFRPSSNPAIPNVNLPSQETPNVAYQTVRASAQGFAFFTARNILVNVAGAAGITMASFNPFFHVANSVARWTAGTAIVGTAIPGGINLVSPDLTVKQLNNLDDQAFRDGMLIPNNTQIRTMVFVERRLLDGIGHTAYQHWCDTIYPPDTIAKKTTTDPPKPDTTTPERSDASKKCGKTKDDPSAVKLALGQIEIVGDEINFIQRVVVDQTVASQEVNPSLDIGTVVLSASLNQINVTASGMTTNYAQVKASITNDSASTVPPNTKLILAVDSSDANHLVFTPPHGTTLTGTATYAIQFILPNGLIVNKTLTGTPAK